MTHAAAMFCSRCMCKPTLIFVNFMFFLDFFADMDTIIIIQLNSAIYSDRMRRMRSAAADTVPAVISQASSQPPLLSATSRRPRKNHAEINRL